MAIVLTKWAPADAFEFILRAAFFGMILSWIVSLAAHISFRRRTSPEEIAALPLRSPLGAGGSAIGLAVVCGVVLKGWYDSRINLVSGVVYLIFLTAAYFIIKATRKTR